MSLEERDNCEFCHGMSGGFRGHEKMLHGRILCKSCFDDRILVFGSNLAGRHGKGAALHALKHFGAKRGLGHGWHWHSYALPTKDFHLKILRLDQIKENADKFIGFATTHLHLVFELTRVGCGLAHYKDYQIGPMFAFVPHNVIVPLEWREYVRRPRPAVQSSGEPG